MIKEMTYPQAIFLAIIQGLTEFLPVSSSGHLVLFQKLFGLRPPVLFDILVHVGTLGAILVFFRKELINLVEELIRKNKTSWRFFWLIVLGTMPVVIGGLFLESRLEVIFDSLELVGLAWLVTAGLLFWTKTFQSFKRKKVRGLDALLIGLFQALAILPGLSRSGATIVAGLSRKLDQETAFRFSFLLAVPAIFGALALEITDLMSSTWVYLYQGLLGMVIAGLIGYLALSLLKSFLLRAKLWFFGFYCLILGLLVLL